jgi:hypothetical protein
LTPPVSTTLPATSTSLPSPSQLRAASNARNATLDQELLDGLLRADLQGLPRALGEWDKAVVYLNGCHSGWESPTVRPCRFGAARGPLIVLAGDSHAAHLQPLVERWAIQRKWRFVSITKAGCPFVAVKPILAEESKLALGLPYPSCSTWQRNAAAKIEQLRPDVLLLPLLSRRGLAEPGRLATWRREIDRTVKRFTPMTRVVVLGDDPQVGIHIPRCLRTHKDPRKCIIAWSDAIRSDRLAVERAATLRAGGEFHDISRWFCTTGGCPAVANRFVIRRDDNHVAAAYARHIWSRLDPVLQPWR